MDVLAAVYVYGLSRWLENNRIGPWGGGNEGGVWKFTNIPNCREFQLQRCALSPPFRMAEPIRFWFYAAYSV